MPRARRSVGSAHDNTTGRLKSQHESLAETWTLPTLPALSDAVRMLSDGLLFLLVYHMPRARRSVGSAHDNTTGRLKSLHKSLIKNVGGAHATRLFDGKI
ncbi:MAG: hypothetical protein Q4G28_03620 [Neisseria sp.]|nr:hypothetical protein [Neisseria sp.]